MHLNKCPKPIAEDFNPYRYIPNQSVENADVAFVKGASDRNEFFEKINKQ